MSRALNYVAQRYARGERIVRVGKYGTGDYSTIQGAVDYVVAKADAAADNRYVILVEPGIYNERVYLTASHTDVVGLARGSSIVDYQTVESDTGGTFIVSNNGVSESGNEAFDCVIANMRFVRNAAGDSAESGPPEAALFVGKEEIYNDVPAWDRVWILDNIIEGVHDGLQLFGTNRAATTAPRVVVQGNVIRSCHDAVTIKGCMHYSGVGNHVEVDSTGFDPYLDSIADWKSTGYHINLGRPTIGADFTCPAYLRRISLVGERIDVYANGNIGLNGAVGQDTVAGIYVYDAFVVGQGGLRSMHPTTVDACSINVIYDNDHEPTNEVGGIVVLFDGIGRMQRGEMTVTGGSINVEQLHATGPASVYGVFVDSLRDNGAAADTLDFQIVGTVVNGSNAAGTCYTMRAEQASDEIFHAIYSSLGEDTGGAGALTPFPVSS